MANAGEGCVTLEATHNCRRANKWLPMAVSLEQMKTRKVSFKNAAGQLLSGRMELPAAGQPHSYAIFAHCFTCSKNLRAAVDISRELARSGFGVLRFDFTGLGASEGEFSDTNFSGNVEDLVEAAKFLEAEYGAPALLVGHSLGGAAVLFAAARLPSVKAVAVIGAPSDPEHVSRLLQSSEEEIERTGSATVHLEGRGFIIKKQFLDDLRNKRTDSVVKDFGKALLILHSPQDATVDITNAEAIYKAAHHPKSFISLDGADHLLTRHADALYAGRIIGQWASRYVDTPATEEPEGGAGAVASLSAEDKYTTSMWLDGHHLVADEPEAMGGGGLGPSPYDYVAGGLAACKAITARLYARRKQWDLQHITVEVDHDKAHIGDCAQPGGPTARIDRFRCRVRMEGDLTPEQRQRILEIADRCPVHRTLVGGVKIQSELVDRA